MDRFALDSYVEYITPVAGGAAGFAGHEHVRQEHHLYLDMTGALTRLAPTARQVEGEGCRGVLPLLRERLPCEQLPDLVERLDIGDWIRARRPADGRLVHQQNILQELPAGHRCNLSHRLAEMGLGRMLAAELRLEVAIDHVMQQRALSRA